MVNQKVNLGWRQMLAARRSRHRYLKDRLFFKNLSKNMDTGFVCLFFYLSLI